MRRVAVTRAPKLWKRAARGRTQGPRSSSSAPPRSREGRRAANRHRPHVPGHYSDASQAFGPTSDDVVNRHECALTAPDGGRHCERRRNRGRLGSRCADPRIHFTLRTGRPLPQRDLRHCASTPGVSPRRRQPATPAPLALTRTGLPPAGRCALMFRSGHLLAPPPNSGRTSNSSRTPQTGAETPLPRLGGLGSPAGQDLLPKFAGLRVGPATGGGACAALMRTR
jgi:hypothetical protein